MGAPQGNKNAAGKRGGAGKITKARKTKKPYRSYFDYVKSHPIRFAAEMRARDKDPRYKVR